MNERYISERLLQELPRPLVNFVWYLWEMYGDADNAVFRVTITDADGQRFYVHATGDTIIQDFGCRTDADIAIRREGSRAFMEYC